MIEFDSDKLDEIIKHENRIIVDKINNFLNNHKDILNNNKFDELYTLFQGEHPTLVDSILTAILLKANINFIMYLNKIPVNCFYELPITYITIPKNIKQIGYCAFEGCKNLDNIYYDGTKEEFIHDVKVAYNWTVSSTIDKVICNDGEIILNEI